MARDFDGVDDRILVSPNPNLTNTFSMWCWAKSDTTAAGQGQFISSDKDTTTTARNFQFRRNGAAMDFILFVANAAITRTVASAVTTGWKFYAAVKRAGNLFLYHAAPGAALSETDTGAIGTPDNDGWGLTIGARQSNTTAFVEFFDGKIAGAGLSATVGLTLGELESVRYRGGFSTRAALFQLALFGTGSPEPDWSGNANNGTVTGAIQGDHAPAGPMFGFDYGWQGAFTAAAPAAGHPAMRRWGHVLHMPTTSPRVAGIR